MNPQTRYRVALAIGMAGAFVATLCAVAYRVIDEPWIGRR